MADLVFVSNKYFESPDYSEFIEGCNTIVRFNDAGSLQTGMAGERTDILCINNEAKHWWDDNGEPANLSHDLVASTKEIWFVRPDNAADLIGAETTTDRRTYGDNSDKILEDFAAHRLEWKKIAPHHYMKLIHALGNPKHPRNLEKPKTPLKHHPPSCGTVGIWMIMADPRFRNHNKYLIEFNWYIHDALVQGKLHPFYEERNLWVWYMQKGWLNFHDISRDTR